ncbi:Poly(3-hydroxybutyrate) depolymerase [Diplocarpon rosae]|nr:Poly(3-hydroxybutyrate) depolymerase [Diplocarpon rosae]
MLQSTLIPLVSLLSIVTGASVPSTKVPITSSGVPRYYLVTVPPNFNPQNPSPVIFSFHGNNHDAEDQYELTQLSDPYFNDYAIAVYPNGLGESWQGHPDSTANDLQFTLDIIADLKSNYTIDETRLYASGKSVGGGFVGVLACNETLSNKFAAFAPVSGAFYIKNDTTCAPATIKVPCNPGRAKIPMIEFHGGEDGTIKYQGAPRNEECVPSILSWVEQWAARDGLEEPQRVESAVSSNTTLYQYQTTDGEDLGLVSHVFDAVIDHSWPSTLNNSDNLQHGDGPASFNASTIIVDFFKRYTLEQ